MQKICQLSKLKGDWVKNWVMKYDLQHLSTAGTIYPSKLSLKVDCF